MDPDEKDAFYAPAITLHTICEEGDGSGRGGGGLGEGGSGCGSGGGLGEGGSGCGEGGSGRSGESGLRDDGESYESNDKHDTNTLEDIESYYYSNEDIDDKINLLSTRPNNKPSPFKDNPIGGFRRNSILVVEPRYYLSHKGIKKRKNLDQLKSKSIDVTMKDSKKETIGEMKIVVNEMGGRLLGEGLVDGVDDMGGSMVRVGGLLVERNKEKDDFNKSILRKKYSEKDCLEKENFEKDNLLKGDDKLKNFISSLCVFDHSSPASPSPPSHHHSKSPLLTLNQRFYDYYHIIFF